ncbi:MAG: cupin [Spirulinaceae cyanobacterium]
MTDYYRDWLVNNQGNCLAYEALEDHQETNKPYRLYRFLTDLENILEEIPANSQRLKAITPLVRRLLSNSYWLQGEYLEPDPEQGWSVLMLYDEPNFPLTIQTVVWLPGRVSPLHNHGTWGLVALIKGQEKNTFWQRNGEAEFPDQLSQVGEQVLAPGDIISFLPDAIHGVEALGEEPTVTFNIYGETDYENRFEFDIKSNTATKF